MSFRVLRSRASSSYHSLTMGAFDEEAEEEKNALTGKNDPGAGVCAVVTEDDGIGCEDVVAMVVILLVIASRINANSLSFNFLYSTLSLLGSRLINSSNDDRLNNCVIK